MSHGWRREVSTVKVGLSVAAVAGVTAVSSDRAAADLQCRTRDKNVICTTAAAAAVAGRK